MFQLMPIIFSALFFLNVPFVEAQVQAPEKEQETKTDKESTEPNSTENQAETSVKETTSPDNWVEVQDEKGLFKALFPSKPHYKFEEMPIPNTEFNLKNEQYIAGNEKKAVLILLIFYPQQFIKSHLINEEEIVNKIVKNQAAKDPKAKIVLNPIQYKNHQAYSFRITTDKNIMAGVMFLINNIAYNLTYVESVDSFSEDDFQYFLNHFELTPTGEKPVDF